MARMSMRPFERPIDEFSETALNHVKDDAGIRKFFGCARTERWSPDIIPMWDGLSVISDTVDFGSIDTSRVVSMEHMFGPAAGVREELSSVSDRVVMDQSGFFEDSAADARKFDEEVSDLLGDV